MDFEIESKMDGDVLVVTISGRLTEENVGAISERCFEVVSRSKATRVLIDNRQLAGRLSLASSYLHIRSLAGKQIHAATVALVNSQDNRDNAEFLETAAVNAGHPLKYFFDYDEALTWLRNR